MDLYIPPHDAEFSPPPSPFYCEGHVLKQGTDALLSQTKQVAFSRMDQLEGWCTREKAAILIDLIFMTKAETVVEIGVWGGKSLVPMAQAIRALGKGQVYGIDPWDPRESVKGQEGANYNWWGSVNHDHILRGLQGKIAEFGLNSQITLVRATSEEAPPITGIDLLHIDGNHGEACADLDVKKWVPLVRKGGIIIFDDMTWGTNASAVDWLNRSCIKLAEYTEGNVWGVWIKP